MKKENKLRSFR